MADAWTAAVAWPGSAQPIDRKWYPEADREKFVVTSKLQPYFKLHGSSNWFDDINGQPMLVLGGNKEPEIERHEVLKWSHRKFREYLLKPDTRLMVIGYSFRDKHINKHIREAASGGNLRLFIIDPCGVDVARNAKERYGELGKYRLLQELQPHFIGASRRTLRDTFGGSDEAEYWKVMKVLGLTQR